MEFDVRKRHICKVTPACVEALKVRSLYTRPAYLVAENEARLKNNAIKMRIFKTLCLAIKHQQHGIGAQTAIVQNLQYYEHLSDPMAELLQILTEQYDYPHLTDEILRYPRIKCMLTHQRSH